MGRATRTGTAEQRGDGPRLPGSGIDGGPGGPVTRGTAVVGLVALAVVAGALAGPWDPPLRRQEAEAPDPLPVTPPAPVDPPPDPMIEALEQIDVQPWDLTWLGVALMTLIGLGVLYLVVRWVRDRPPPRVEEPPDPLDVVPGEVVGTAALSAADLDTLRDGLQGAEDELAGRRRPADAVIAAWVVLEDSAAACGVVRDPASTPTEFTVTVLDRTAADRGASRTLLDLYLRARFGDERLTPDDVGTARTAVATLAADLARERGGAAGGDPDGLSDPDVTP